MNIFMQAFASLEAIVIGAMMPYCHAEMKHAILVENLILTASAMPRLAIYRASLRPLHVMPRISARLIS